MITPYSNTISVTTEKFPFEFTINTANTSSGSTAADQFKLPLVSSLPLNAVVDWGDGSSDTITVWNQAETTHTYDTTLTTEFTVSITGDLSGWKFGDATVGGDKLKMLNVNAWGSLNISVDSGFVGCTNLTATATDAPLITTTSFSSMFNSCANFNGAIGNWNVSSVISFGNAFNGCTNFNADISNWNVSNASNFGAMFRSCGNFNQPIGNWTTSSMGNIVNMFRSAGSFDQDLSNWDIETLSSATSLFVFTNGLSTANYDPTLVSWEAQLQAIYPNGVGYPYTISINFANSKYTIGSAADTARTSLINNFNWTITDGGGI